MPVIERPRSDPERARTPSAMARATASLTAPWRSISAGSTSRRFVFDALPAARRTCVLETDPLREFSPIKNAEGGESPETARRDLVAQYRLWLEAAGLPVPTANRLIEIDHAYMDNLDDARALARPTEGDLADRIRFGPEVHA